jgi:hypothetical protein
MSLTRPIKTSELELIEYLEKRYSSYSGILTLWEKRFMLDIIGKYWQYKSNMLVSNNQVNQLLKISEKVPI